MNETLNMKINLKVYLSLCAIMAVLITAAKYLVGLQNPYVFILSIIAAITAIPVYFKLAKTNDEEKASE